MYLIVFQCILEICSWPPSTATLASIPRGCHVMVVVVQHDGYLNVVVQKIIPGTVEKNEIAKVFQEESRLFTAPLFTDYGFWAGLLQAAHGHAMPRQPQRASLHGRISAVCFGSVGEDEFDVGGFYGWTNTQYNPILCIFVFLGELGTRSARMQVGRCQGNGAQ